MRLLHIRKHTGTAMLENLNRRFTFQPFRASSTPIQVHNTRSQAPTRLDPQCDRKQSEMPFGGGGDGAEGFGDVGGGGGDGADDVGEGRNGRAGGGKTIEFSARCICALTVAISGGSSDEDDEDERIQRRMHERDNRVDGNDGGLVMDDRIDYIFDIPEAPVLNVEALRKADNRPYWQMVLLLVAWLHAFYHLPHRACRLILRVLGFLFATLRPDDFAGCKDHVETLASAMRRLGLRQRYLILPMCPTSTCQRIIPAGSPVDSLCPGCGSEMYERRNRASINDDDDEAWNLPENYKPKVRYPLNPISRQLPVFLNSDGIEDLLDAWRDRTPNRADTELLNIMDGRVWKTLNAHDGGLFFDTNPEHASKDELRIGLTLGFDGSFRLTYSYL